MKNNSNKVNCGSLTSMRWVTMLLVNDNSMKAKRKRVNLESVS